MYPQTRFKAKILVRFNNERPDTYHEETRYLSLDGEPDQGVWKDALKAVWKLENFHKLVSLEVDEEFFLYT